MKTKAHCPWRAVHCALVLVLAASAGTHSASAAALVRGELSREVYTNIFGPLISDLTNSAKFPAAPDLVGSVTSFETPTDAADMYGERLTGYVIPPVTGAYVFYLASDDQGALYLSPNYERSNLVQIATESNWSWHRNWTDLGGGRTNHENISKPVYLEAGKAYYVEALHKEAMGGDTFGVAWRPPGMPPPANGSDPIPGYCLGIQRQDRSPMVHVVTPAEGAVLVAGTHVQLGANVLNADDTLIRVEFYANESPLGRAGGPSVTPAGNYLLTWSNIPPGNFALTARVIDASGLITASAPVHVTSQPPPPGEAELHVVSVYSGRYDGGPSPNHEEGMAAVLVNRPGQKVTLCLCAYEPVLWLVTPTNGTVIEKIILSGFYEQRVQGVGPEVDILRYGYGGSSGTYFWPGYEMDTGRFYRTVPIIHAITGLEVGSFHGAYTAPYAVPFVIDSPQNDPRLRSDYPQPTPASELPNLRFQLSFFSGTRPGSGQVYSRDYRTSGPMTGDNVLPGLRVVPDASQRYFYASLSQSVLRVDSQSGVGEIMNLSAGVPELSWSMGMAFDSLRNRELLVSLGGEGFLYAYAPERDQWSLISSMQNRDLDSIVYHANQDAIYGYEVYRADYNHPRLFRFDAQGTYQGEMQLPVFPWDVGVSSYASELVSVGDYLVLLLGPDATYPVYPSQRLESRMYLIDPRTSQVWLTYRHVPANKLPSVVISSPTDGATFVLASPIHIEAQTFDPDGYVQDVEFYADGRSLGKVTRSWGRFELIWTDATLGTHLLTAKATDSDLQSSVSFPVQVTVTLPTPIIKWSNPADIVYGTPLGGAQLNATATVPGTFTYLPPAGSVLGAGHHILTVSFAPSDPAYPTASATVSLQVNRAPLSIRADDKIKMEGTPNPPLTATYVGFVAGDNPASLDQPLTLATAATLTSPPGAYPIVAVGASDSNYTISFVNGMLTVLTRPQVLPAPEDQDMPAIASDGSNFLVVWLDRRERAGRSWVECDVYGARVTGNGSVLDPDGILIGSNSASGSPPAVGFDGVNYFVVWQSYESGSMGPIHGSRVTPGGQLLDSIDGFRIGAATGRLQSDAKVAFNGNFFLVAWNDWRNQTNGIPENLICDIYGARVTRAGAVLDPENIPIIKAPLWQTCAGVAAVGEEFLVIWQDMDGVRGARVGNSGVVSTPFLVSSGIRGSVARPVMAALRDHYLAAWEESFNLGNNMVWSWVAATRLSATGLPLDGRGFGVRTNAGGYNHSLAVATAPESWWLAWKDENVHGTTPGIWGARVGTARNVSEAIPINILPVLQGRPAMGCNGSLLLAAWSDKRNTLGEPYPHLQFGNIFATLIALDGKVLDTNGFLVSSVTMKIPAVQWAAPPPITYGTPLGGAQLNATADVPGSFAYTPPAGTLLHAGADQVLTVVFTPPDLQHYLRVTNSVTIDILPAPLSIRADNKLRLVGQPNPPLTATYIGLVAGELPSSLEHPATLTTAATIESPPGVYPIIVAGASDPDYTITFINGTLTVAPALPPTITVQPHNQTNFVSQTARFSVAATGTPPLRYQWRKDGVELPYETNATLVLSHVTLNNAGVYRVVVSNRAGSVMSDPALLVVLPAHTGPGSLDLTFHPRPGLDSWRYGADCIVTQPDGKLLIGGYFNNYDGVPRDGFARINPDGSLDAEFAPRLNTPEDYPAGVMAIALQPDGKILVGGWFDSVNGTPRRNFVRLHPDGRLDESFATELESGTVQTIALQRDGKILIGGSFEFVNGVPRRYLARLNRDGTLDQSFQPARLEIGDDWYITSLALQSDGKVLVGGHIFDVPWESYLGLVRLLPDGSLDTEFRDHVQADYAVFYLFVEPDDKILIDAGVTAYGRHCTGPSRLHRDGTLDTSFLPPPNLDWRWTMDLAPDGKILIAGFDHIIQLNPNGAINTRFVTSFAGGADNRVLCVAVQPDGQVLIEGDFTEVNGVPVPGLARLNGDMAPRILSQPTNQVCVAGGTVTFRVQAVGSPVLHYQWQKNSTDLLGKTNAQLTLEGVQLADAGLYRGIVSNGSGATVSFEAKLTVLPASGQSGSVDLTFDPTRAGGLVGLEGDQGFVYRLAVQPDGKVIAAGDFVGANGVPRRDFVRLNPDGSTDLHFHATITPGRIVEAIALQSNGQILIGGNFDQVNHHTRFNLARLNPDGSLDLSFAPVLGGGSRDLVKSIVVQPDGKILVGGNFSSANNRPRYHVARLNPDGSVDPTFVPAFMPLGDNSLFNCLALQPDGKVLVGHASCNAAIALRRLNADGSLDGTFGLGVAPGTWCVGVRQVEVAPEGKLVIYGQFGPWRYVARLNSDGSEDKGFVTPPFRWLVRTIRVQPDGKVLVAGADSGSEGVTPNGILRLNQNGSIDIGFQVPEQVVGHPNEVYDLALRPDGRILLCKAYNSTVRYPARSIVQLRSSGSVDSDFRLRLHPVNANVMAILPLPKGRAIIGGHFTRLNDVRRVGLAGLTAEGTLDASFVPPAEPLNWVEVLGRQKDGRILVGGSFYSTNPPFSRNLVRLNPNGSLDTSFHLPASVHGSVRALAVQPDGRILIGGGFNFGRSPSYLARLRPDGSLDNSFEQGTGIGGEDVSIETIVLQRDGKILVGGMFQIYNGVPRSGLLRLNPNGSLDQRFRPPPEVEWAWRIGLQPDGRIIVLAGSLLRLMPDGSLDASFQAPPEVYGFALEPGGKLIVTGSFDALGDGPGGNALIRLKPDGSPDLSFKCRITEGWINAIALQADGRVLIGGTFEEVNGVERAYIARLNNKVVPPRHPADISPADWALRPGEVNAYAAAWRAGDAWVEAPNPIPIDYVTQAAALLLGGSDYRWDGNAACPPLWWVNPAYSDRLVPRRTGDTPASGEEWLSPRATRRLPRWYTPGHPFEVSIDVAPRRQTLAGAVQENVPAGCRVVQISDGGHFDVEHWQVKWGPFKELHDRVLRYMLLPDPTNTAPITIAGTVSFDGSSGPVEGASHIRYAPRLAWEAPRVKEGLMLRLGGDPGDVFAIETSADLVHWTTVMTLTNTTGTLEIPLRATAESQRYYRAVPVPPAKP